MYMHFGTRFNFSLVLSTNHVTYISFSIILILSPSYPLLLSFSVAPEEGGSCLTEILGIDVSFLAIWSAFQLVLQFIFHC